MIAPLLQVLGVGLAALLALTACEPAEISPPSGSGPFETLGRSGGSTGGLAVGSVVLLSQPYRAKRSVVVSRVEPSFHASAATRGLVHRDSRVSFLGQRGASNGYPGITCAPRWPLRGFGPALGFPQTISAGESFVPIVYLETARSGSWRITALKVVFEERGIVGTQLLNNVEWQVEARMGGVPCSWATGAPWTTS